MRITGGRAGAGEEGEGEVEEEVGVVMRDEGVLGARVEGDTHESDNHDVEPQANGAQ